MRLFTGLLSCAFLLFLFLPAGTARSGQDAAPASAAVPQADPAYYDLSAVFSRQDFEKIVMFVLKYGNTQTYCSRYNDNPHYSFNSFELYLNPGRQFSIIPLSDYHDFCIYTPNPPDRSPYINIQSAKPDYLGGGPHKSNPDDPVILSSPPAAAVTDELLQQLAAIRFEIFEEIARLENGQGTSPYGKPWQIVTDPINWTMHKARSCGRNPGAEDIEKTKNFLIAKYGPVAGGEIAKLVFSDEDYASRTGPWVRHELLRMNDCDASLRWYDSFIKMVTELTPH